MSLGASYICLSACLSAFWPLSLRMSLQPSFDLFLSSRSPSLPPHAYIVHQGHLLFPSSPKSLWSTSHCYLPPLSACLLPAKISIPTCISASLLLCLPACLSSSLYASFPPPCLPPSIHACLSSSLPAFLHS